MKLSNQPGDILAKRKVYFVVVYNRDNKIGCFLSSPMAFVMNRQDAALFDTREEAEELMKQARNNGIGNLIPDCLRMSVSFDIQYLHAVWNF